MNLIRLIAISATAAAAAPAAPACPSAPFTGGATLNNTICTSAMQRNRGSSAEASPDACKTFCCDAGPSKCNAWLYHVDAKQCWFTADKIDPRTCRHWNGKGTKWQGETRHPGGPTPKPEASRKRGFSGFLGNHFTCDDAKALNLSDSWYYNWITNPTQQNKCGQHGNVSFEFVPIINGVNSANAGPSGQWQTWWREANAHYLLGYNEPDPGHHPHAASPADAAAAWPKVQGYAAAMDPPLILVSPAVSTKGIDNTGRSQWLDEFLGNCSTVVEACDPDLIKYVAFHDYEGNVSQVVGRVKGAAARYKRPIWLTEIAILGCPWCKPNPWTATRAMQDAYMKELLPALDALPELFRYAWFTARNVPNAMNGGSSLLPYNSSSLVPTSTGRLYAPQVV